MSSVRRRKDSSCDLRIDMIATVDQNWAIGNKGNLLISEDQKGYFSILRHTVVLEERL